MGPSSSGLHDSFGLQQSGPGFGSPPLLGISRPSSGLSLKGAQRYTKSDEKASSLRTSGGLTKEWTGKVAVPNEWKVDCLQQVPPDFPLERTKKEIRGSDGCEIAARISAALQKLSIEAEYCGETGKAKCRTTDYVSFRIRLFAGGDEGQPVVVEMQRRSGSCCSFMKSCRAILAAAEGLPMPLRSGKMPPSKKPIREMKCLKGIIGESKQSDREQDMKSALDCAAILLGQNQRESTILALENICLLTDPLKTVPETALETSKCVVLGDESRTIREDVAAILKSDIRDIEFEEGLEGHMEQAYQIHHLALSVFSNSLCMTAKDGCLQQAVKDQEWFVDFLIPTLMKEIECAEECPNVACAASCCLKSLVSSSSVARDCLVELEGEEALIKARDFGARRHEMLGNEATHCVSAMQNSWE